MKLSQTLGQKPTVSPQLVLANELLQFSSLELEQAITQELAENPALELGALPTCPICGSEMGGGYCASCGVVDTPPDEEWGDRGRDGALDSYEFRESGGSAEWDDPLSGVACSTTLAHHVLDQARLNLPAEDVVIAVHLVEGLDDRGFLCSDLDDVASALNVERARVDNVLSTIQGLDPVGVAARDARQCLLIQLRHLRREGIERSLAKLLIRECWEMLGRHSLENIARDVGVSVEEVSEALQFVRENLNPFPAHASWASPRRGAPEDKVAYPQPDVIIRESKAKKGEYEIELPRARGLGLRVGTSYRQAMGRLGVDDASANGQGWKRWEEFRARARLFVSSVEQRWRTLYDMMCILVDCQRDFLSHGERRLNPLTRARVAEMMGVHESTVSRAVADKYVELPTGKVVPLKKFFDSAAPVRQAIQRLVDRESEPLSDSAIARRLRQQGYDVARRTVAKYRNALGILPYSLRRRKKDLSPDRP